MENDIELTEALKFSALYILFFIALSIAILKWLHNLYNVFFKETSS